jgi:Uma2 family endonuclease
MGAHPATASPLVRRYTLEEFWELEPPPEGGHYELIAGVLYVVPPPSVFHSVVVSRLLGVASRYAGQHHDRCVVFVPRAAVWTPSDTYLEPDFFLVSTDRLRREGEDAFRTAELVVEVLSASNTVYDRTAKADTYAALGVRELWLADPASGTIEQRVLDRGAWRLEGRRAGAEPVASVTFPGLTVVPDEVFAPL